DPSMQTHLAFLYSATDRRQRSHGTFLVLIEFTMLVSQLHYPKNGSWQSRDSSTGAGAGALRANGPSPCR
ncbi:MAG: hypothetical protein VST67_14190, partial [Nitrospirota bacterium]|nr:hypothetical protein [Nitrospirota bacterium]